MTLLLGDSLEQLKRLPDHSVDACVTDPPYGLKFMGKKWDYDVPSVELWREVFRVLKPGAHLLSFGGTRTYHRMVVAIEDAGFEVRDQIQWIYGSGFPKSLDVSKAIDKGAGKYIAGEVLPSSRKSPESQTGIATTFREKTAANPQTDDAKRWQGFGTALKPATEPIVLARKPLEKGLTVAENVLKWGCGALNVDGTRIGTDNVQCKKPGGGGITFHGQTEKPRLSGSTCGRWPANVLFDEQAAEMLGEPSRFFYVAKASKRERNAGLEGMPLKPGENHQELGPNASHRQGNAQERAKGITHVERKQNQNHHPTVKPIKLMEYLIKLITQPSGTVLDPFMGSGSTGVAAKSLGIQFIGVELSEEYLEIAKRRIEASSKKE